MEIKLMYLDELNKHGLKKEDLPKDAQIGISELNKIIKSIKMLETQNKKVSASVMDKVATLDKWTYYEILDFINDTDKNSEKPADSDEIIEDIESEEEIVKNNSVGQKINEELAAFFVKHGNSQNHPIDLIKSECPSAYSEIFKAYVSGEPNGVETTEYALIETSENIYSLKKLQ